MVVHLLPLVFVALDVVRLCAKVLVHAFEFLFLLLQTIPRLRSLMPAVRRTSEGAILVPSGSNRGPAQRNQHT